MKGCELFILAEGTLNGERQFQSLFISLGKKIKSLVSMIAYFMSLAYILCIHVFILFYSKTSF